MSTPPAATVDSTSIVEQSSVRVLILQKAAEFVHESTTALVETVRELGAHFNWLVVVAHADHRELDDLEQLLLFNVVFFAHTSGNILNDRQLDNLAEFSATSRHGVVGWHAAADTHRDDERFRTLFGAKFIGHPLLQNGRVTFDNKAASELGLGGMLPESLEVYDEFYNFNVNLSKPGSGFRCFAFADESSYKHDYERKEWEGTTYGEGEKHPLGWYRDLNGARSVYFALGHTTDSYKLEPIRHILTAAINWAGYFRQLNDTKEISMASQVSVDVAARGVVDFREELAVVSTKTKHFYVVIQHKGFQDVDTMSRCVPPENLDSVHFFISDATVDKLYGDAIERVLSIVGVKNLVRLPVPEGENNKSTEKYLELVDAVLTGGVDKYSTIITLGGGMVNNLAGMVAATVYRGLRLVHLSTSLLSQVDAATGVKQAVNWKTGKNQIGCIYAPSYVIIDTAVLKTLPMRERINGLSEAIKHALCQDTEFLQYLMKHNKADLEDDNFLHQVVKIAASKKALCLNSTGASDYAEMCMQYGHAFGHAVEHLSNYDMRHGEAIAIGMTLSCEVAILLGHGDPLRLEQVLLLHQRIFSQYNLPWQVPESMTVDQIANTLRWDKHFAKQLPQMMTLRDAGIPYATKDGRTAFRISYEVIEQAIKNNRGRSEIDTWSPGSPEQKSQQD